MILLFPITFALRLFLFYLFLGKVCTRREDMADGVFFVEILANMGISSAFGNFFFIVNDADDISLLNTSFYPFNTFKEIAGFDNFTIKNGSLTVSCFVGKHSKMFGKWKVSDSVLFQDLL